VAPPRVRALVLAAGRGERLRPLTEELAKPLLPVAGRPLAAWTLERLRRAGVDAAALNLHHRGERIRAAFGESFRGLPLVYSEEPELLGTGGALPPLRDFFAAADVALLVNGDSLCRWPLERLRLSARRRPAQHPLPPAVPVDLPGRAGTTWPRLQPVRQERRRPRSARAARHGRLRPRQWRVLG